MDLNLPEIDGWEATGRLKDDPATCAIPIIAMSAHALTGEREKALAAGCDDFDTKPIEFDRLLAKIEPALAPEASGLAQPNLTRTTANQLAAASFQIASTTKQRCRSTKGGDARFVSTAAARRELEELRAAINYHRLEGLCSEIVSVALPEKAEGHDVFLERSQAARLLRAAWCAKQVMRGKATRRGVGKHVARFILVGLYTGTRHAAICGAALQPAVGRGRVDLERGVFHRRAKGDRKTK